MKLLELLERPLNQARALHIYTSLSAALLIRMRTATFGELREIKIVVAHARHGGVTTT